MKKKKIVILSKAVVYFSLILFIGAYFSLAGECEGIDIYFLLVKSMPVALGATVLILLVDKWMTSKISNEE